MSRSPVRVVLIVALAAVVVAAAVVAAGAATTTGARASRPRLSEIRLLQISERAAAAAGDPAPTLIQHSQGTRRHAVAVASGDRVPGTAWSYLIAERGSFVLKGASVPPGSSTPRGRVLTLVVDADTGASSDLGVSDHYPDLVALSPVSTDLRQPASGCLRRPPTRLAPEVWPPARARLAPRGARSIQLCRYSGLNAHPALALDRMRLLRTPPVLERLTRQLDLLPAPPRGPVACPSDDESQIVLTLRYPDGHAVPVDLELTGCRMVTNGTVLRTASGFGPRPSLGPQLIGLLQRVLANGDRAPSRRRSRHAA